MKFLQAENNKIRLEIFTHDFFSGFVLVCENSAESDLWSVNTCFFFKPCFSDFYGHSHFEVNQQHL
jgi:hypothetical protein